MTMSTNMTTVFLSLSDHTMAKKHLYLSLVEVVRILLLPLDRQIQGVFRRVSVSATTRRTIKRNIVQAAGAAATLSLNTNFSRARAAVPRKDTADVPCGTYICIRRLVQGGVAFASRSMAIG